MVIAKMRYYLMILLIVICIGIGLLINFFNQDQSLDETVFIQTTESIRNLQALDDDFSLLLYKSMHNNTFDNTSLSDKDYQISEEFDNLRFEALFEEIESNPDLSTAIANFEEKFVSRDDILLEYIELNQNVADSLTAIRLSTKQLSKSKLDPRIDQYINQTNSIVYQLALGLIEFHTAQASLPKLEQSTSENYASSFSKHQQATASYLQNYPLRASLFDSLNELNTAPLLNTIGNRYTEYHNTAIESSKLLRNALIVYGLILLLTLVLFAMQIRKNYLSLEQQIVDRTEEINTAYSELKESQEQLIQSEKMASLGQLVAGVAHEINTPLGYVSSNVESIKLNLTDLGKVINQLDDLFLEAKSKIKDKQQLTSKLITLLKSYEKNDTKELFSESEQLLNDGSYGLLEITKLVTSLKDFSRLDRQTTEQVNIHECIESSITIASSHIKENKVIIKNKFSSLPKLICVPSKLNQLFLNVITNACQAMNTNGGTLTITTEKIDNNIQLTFQDNGIGMNDEVSKKIFDPFFTTKEIGKGTGLGMSIAYKIVKQHHGTIDVKSKPGVGTKITISLPL